MRSGWEEWRELSGPLRAKQPSPLRGRRKTRSLHEAEQVWSGPPFFSSVFLLHFQNEASVPRRKRRGGRSADEGGELKVGMKAGARCGDEEEGQCHSVALREKDSLGLDLPLPRIIFCSSFCCFWRSCSSFMRSSWIFLCSSTIRNCSSACWKAGDSKRKVRQEQGTMSYEPSAQKLKALYLPVRSNIRICSSLYV